MSAVRKTENTAFKMVQMLAHDPEARSLTYELGCSGQPYIKQHDVAWNLIDALREKAYRDIVAEDGQKVLDIGTDLGLAGMYVAQKAKGELVKLVYSEPHRHFVDAQAKRNGMADSVQYVKRAKGLPNIGVVVGVNVARDEAGARNALRIARMYPMAVMLFADGWSTELWRLAEAFKSDGRDVTELVGTLTEPVVSKARIVLAAALPFRA